jgi:thiol-disulfide isomerase/thioredoxin
MSDSKSSIPIIKNLSEIDNRPFNKKDYIIVFVYSTTCGYCKRAQPFMVDLHQKLQDKNCQVVGCNIGETNDKNIFDLNPTGTVPVFTMFKKESTFQRMKPQTTIGFDQIKTPQIIQKWIDTIVVPSMQSDFATIPVVAVQKSSGGCGCSVNKLLNDSTKNVRDSLSGRK